MHRTITKKSDSIFSELNYELSTTTTTASLQQCHVLHIALAFLYNNLYTQYSETTYSNSPTNSLLLNASNISGLCN